MKIIDNVLPNNTFKEIQNILLGNTFPWYYYDGINVPGDGHSQFSHIFYYNNRPHSSYYNYIEPFCKILNAAAFLRIKANLYLKSSNIIKHGMHLDNDLVCKIAIFYINNNNGYTGFQDGTVVQSVENRLVIFNSNQYHHGTTCSDENTRVVINFNYLENILI